MSHPSGYHSFVVLLIRLHRALRLYCSGPPCVSLLTLTTPNGDEPDVSAIDINVRVVKARKEVFLIASGIETAYSLLLSIGSVEHLKEVSVDVVKANGDVGTNWGKHLLSLLCGLIRCGRRTFGLYDFRKASNRRMIIETGFMSSAFH